MFLDLFKEQGIVFFGFFYFRVIYVLFFFDFLQKEYFKNEFDFLWLLEGWCIEIRKKIKKKKKVIVEYGMELWMIDSEDEGEGDFREKFIKKIYGNCFVSGEFLDLIMGFKYSDGYLQYNLIYLSDEYFDVYVFVFVYLYLYYLFIINYMNLKYFSELLRFVMVFEVIK